MNRFVRPQSHTVRAAGVGAALLLAAGLCAALGCFATACTDVESAGVAIDASPVAVDAPFDSGQDAGPACEWDLPDGGHVVCPAGAPEGCPGPYDCNACVCLPDLTFACTTHPCKP
jgi:hypothetical protein